MAEVKLECITVQQKSVKISQMMKVEFVAGELIKKADVTNTKLFFL